MKKLIALAVVVAAAGLLSGCSSCCNPCQPCCPEPVYRSPCCPAPSGDVTGPWGAGGAAPAPVGGGGGGSCGGACGR